MLWSNQQIASIVVQSIKIDGALFVLQNNIYIIYIYRDDDENETYLASPGKDKALE